MTDQRPLSPFESTFFGSGTKLGSVPTGGMPLFIGSTVHGAFDVTILRRVLDDLAAGHPLLRSEIGTGTDGARYFRRADDYRPRLDLTEGGETEYLNLVNSPQDWHDGLFRAQLLRDGDRDQLVLIIHHGIADGRSAFALLDEMWRRYTGYATGMPLPQPDSSPQLPAAMDAQLAAVITDETVGAWLDQIRTAAAAMGPESAPRNLPYDGADADPLGRFAVQRIELDASETQCIVDSARAQGLSVNSLLSGAALVAFRAQLDPADGALLLFCGHAVDVRTELDPPLPAATILNCASGVGTGALIDADTSPVAAAHQVAAAMRTAVAQREAAIFLLASQRVRDEVTAAIFAAAPTVAISNMGPLPAHPTPAGIRHIRDDVYAMGPGMPPKLTVFTVGGRLTIQVEYDTARYSRARMGKVSLALIEALQGLPAK